MPLHKQSMVTIPRGMHALIPLTDFVTNTSSPLLLFPFPNFSLPIIDAELIPMDVESVPHSSSIMSTQTMQMFNG